MLTKQQIDRIKNGERVYLSNGSSGTFNGIFTSKGGQLYYVLYNEVEDDYHYMQPNGKTKTDIYFIRLENDSFDELSLRKAIFYGLPLFTDKNTLFIPTTATPKDKDFVGFKAEIKRIKIRAEHQNLDRSTAFLNTYSSKVAYDSLYDVRDDYSFDLNFGKDIINLPIPLSLEQADDYLKTTQAELFVVLGDNNLDPVIYCYTPEFNLDFMHFLRSKFVEMTITEKQLNEFEYNVDFFCRIFRSRAEAMSYLDRL